MAGAHYLYSVAVKDKGGYIRISNGCYSDELMRTDDGWKSLPGTWERTIGAADKDREQNRLHINNYSYNIVFYAFISPDGVNPSVAQRRPSLSTRTRNKPLSLGPLLVQRFIPVITVAG